MWEFKRSWAFFFLKKLPIPEESLDKCLIFVKNGYSTKTGHYPMIFGTVKTKIEGLAYKLLLEEGKKEEEDFSPNSSEKVLVRAAELAFAVVAKTRSFKTK